MNARGGGQHIPRPESAKIAEPAPWLAALEPPGLSNIESVLHGYVPSEIGSRSKLLSSDEPVRDSAVLLPFYEPEAAAGAVMIMTRRPWHMRRHAGELAFPGGGREAQDDSLLDTALREAQEEIALESGEVRLLGELDCFITGGSFKMVTPFVGALAQRPDLSPDPSEVDEIIDISIEELLAPGVYHCERWSRESLEHDVHFFELEGDTLWGASALMVYRLLELVADSRGLLDSSVTCGDARRVTDS